MAIPFKYYVLNEQEIESGALDLRYYTKTQADGRYVLKEVGKSLLSDSVIAALTGGANTNLHKHSALDVINTPSGNISATTVQGAINELDTEKISKTEVYSLLNQDRRIFGVSWNGTSSPTLTRTHDAIGLTANVGIDSAVVVNDFDNLPIFGQIKDVTDLYGNVFVRIPKFYIKKTADGDARTWQVSHYQHDGFYLPWCFWDFTN